MKRKDTTKKFIFVRNYFASKELIFRKDWC